MAFNETRRPMNQRITRRSSLRSLAASAATLTAASALPERLGAAESATGTPRKGRIHHSVCKWCYGKIPLDEFCKAVRDIGIEAIDLLEVDPSCAPDFVLDDLRGLFEPYPLAGIEPDGAVTVGSAVVRNHRGTIEIVRDGDPLDLVRARIAALLRG